MLRYLMVGAAAVAMSGCLMRQSTCKSAIREVADTCVKELFEVGERARKCEGKGPIPEADKQMVLDALDAI